MLKVEYTSFFKGSKKVGDISPYTLLPKEKYTLWGLRYVKKDGPKTAVALFATRVSDIKEVRRDLIKGEDFWNFSLCGLEFISIEDSPGGGVERIFLNRGRWWRHRI